VFERLANATRTRHPSPVITAWAALLLSLGTAAADHEVPDAPTADEYFRELDAHEGGARVDALGNPAAFESFAGGLAGALGGELLGFGFVLAAIAGFELGADAPWIDLLYAAEIVAFTASGVLAGVFATVAGDAAGGDGSMFFAMLGGLLGASVAALLYEIRGVVDSTALGWTALILLPPLAGGGACAVYELTGS
jgi:hypothetical protein